MNSEIMPQGAMLPTDTTDEHAARLAKIAADTAARAAKWAARTLRDTRDRRADNASAIGAKLDTLGLKGKARTQERAKLARSAKNEKTGSLDGTTLTARLETVRGYDSKGNQVTKIEKTTSVVYMRNPLTGAQERAIVESTHKILTSVPVDAETYVALHERIATSEDNAREAYAQGVQDTLTQERAKTPETASTVA